MNKLTQEQIAEIQKRHDASEIFISDYILIPSERAANVARNQCKSLLLHIAALEAEKKELQNYIEQLRILYGCRDGCDGCLWCVSRGWLSGNNPDQEPKK